MKHLFLSILFACFALLSFAQDSIYIKVHFLYGSTPKKEFPEETSWFGGKLGGHVGIEYDSNRIIDFVPSGSFHKFPSKKDLHSDFTIHNVHNFWSMFGGEPETKKQATVIIPISAAQKQKLDSIVTAYTTNVPYDYAFFGMRCGAAAYDILSQLEILPRYSVKRISKKIFYPKKLRKRLFKKAEENQWQILRREGSGKRNWEKD